MLQQQHPAKLVVQQHSTLKRRDERWLTGYAGAALSPAGEHAGRDDPGRIRVAEEDATGGGRRKGLGLLVVSLGHHARERRWTPAGYLDGVVHASKAAGRGIWVDDRARPATIVLDAGLLGLTPARLEAHAGAALERESGGRRRRLWSGGGGRRRWSEGGGSRRI
jgi:hypothetical protein